MKRHILQSRIGTASLAVAAIILGGAVAAQAQLVDGFSGSLNPYTWTPLNNAGTGSSSTSISFNDSTGELGVDVANQAGTAVQGVFLRNDYTLQIGYALTATVDWQSSGLEDFGICVGDNAQPTPASGDNTDVRSGTAYVFAAIRGDNGHVTSSGYDGSQGQLNLLQAQNLSPGVTKLALERASADTFNIYYDQGSGLTLLGTQTVTTSSTVGNAIGFYADVRANGNPAMGYLDNLSIAVVPEPSSLALIGLGFGALLFRRKRA